MLCAVYKSIRKPQTYLFVAKRDDFEQVPTPLLEQFGPPKLVTILNITENTKMVMADATKVIQEVSRAGFYLQLPPPPVDHLKEHKNWTQKKQESQ
ncbi:YcgL domain-containing protein [Psychromonas sp. RZ22]|uniref:YcgL domain-containing protein n=1 Tax=Psychromonas algarum TaxID=2555643 RepID=UPI0010688D32|nr:YcgL domain-containing protein [Psychromonas sp. RZ22]TEW54376.1 YcgL domain-containing protein [Psychromonas sp. RZ22]